MGSATLKITEENTDNAVVLVLEGPIDSVTLEQFKTALHEATLKCNSRVILDCEKLTYMNSTSLGLLTSYHRRCMKNLGALILSGVNQHLRKTMGLLGLGKSLRFCETREEAVAAIPPLSRS